MVRRRGSESRAGRRLTVPPSHTSATRARTTPTARDIRHTHADQICITVPLYHCFKAHSTHTVVARKGDATTVNCSVWATDKCMPRPRGARGRRAEGVEMGVELALGTARHTLSPPSGIRHRTRRDTAWSARCCALSLARTVVSSSRRRLLKLPVCLSSPPSCLILSQLGLLHSQLNHQPPTRPTPQ